MKLLFLLFITLVLVDIISCLQSIALLVPLNTKDENIDWYLIDINQLCQKLKCLNHTTIWFSPLVVNDVRLKLNEAISMADTIITFGPYAISIMLQEAIRHSEKHFAVIDHPVPQRDIPSNFYSVTLADSSLGFLHGYFASLFSQWRGEKRKIGVFGIKDNSLTNKFTQGFSAGVKQVCLDCLVVCGLFDSISLEVNSGENISLMTRISNEAYISASYGLVNPLLIAEDSPSSQLLSKYVQKRYDIALKKFLQLLLFHEDQLPADNQLSIGVADGILSLKSCDTNCTNYKTLRQLLRWLATISETFDSNKCDQTFISRTSQDLVKSQASNTRRLFILDIFLSIINL